MTSYLYEPSIFRLIIDEKLEMKINELTVGVKVANLHNALGVPYNGVSVEGICGIKPKLELLFSVPFPLAEHIGMESVGISRYISQKLKVDFIMSWTFRR